ncbi:LmeA family phospholipid-binding protein [Streptomyces sp. YC537]|uniref:LmeA family phospholipid-binding protein n=1 Tax=Streptomyces boluensis TaxID=1775135 RepID=A0A964UVJ6_9ACTN|nr:LmeA family phospholipid-binding protein [Streptomyces boluensis]
MLYAENLAAQEVQKALKLRAAPEVHIDSFPFLAQVVAGDLDRVEVNVPDVPAGPVSVAQVDVGVDDIRLVGSLPSSVKGAVLGRVRGDVFLAFDDLNREVGASQVKLAPGRAANTVIARGEMPVGDKRVNIRARAEMHRVGERGVKMTVAGARLEVPGLLTYTPGKGGGLQLAAPTAGKVDERELQRATGQRTRPDQLLKGRALDALVEHPALLEPTGIDPSLIEGLRKVQEPKVAEAMEFSARLPDDMPVDLRLRDLRVTKDGVLAELSGKEVAVG